MDKVLGLTGVKGWGILLCFMVLLSNCKKDSVESKKSEIKKLDVEFIEIITNSMEFIMPDTISSGWHRFEYNNNSNETHFILVDKYPVGKSIENTEKEIGPVFQMGMNLIMEGKIDEGFEAFNKLPEWFFKVVFVGGTGLVSPKTKAVTTFRLDPGYYVIECYVKMPDGNFHSNMGMAKALIVTDQVSKTSPPQATNEISISSVGGIKIKDSILAGKQVFSVYFKDQIVHENFVGHDINLVKIHNNSDLSVLESWVNWADPKGLISPAPQGFTFLGGVNDMPAGSSAYFEVDLTPGTYALISEVPHAKSKNLLKTFIISN